ncbi:MAG: XRE family transcriptional regulator [Deltaproteobacteria bacterium]|nr:XRE family transcriptional regulator [Deltaproteobacteria bacterium]
MAKKQKVFVSRNAHELAEAIGLGPADAVEWELRYSLTRRIADTVKRNRLTVSAVAKNAKTSRARVTRVLKGDSQGISIDVLIRILGAVGQEIAVHYKKAA